MTVDNLFDHFICFFDTIYFCDKTNNIQDAIYVRTELDEYDEKAYLDFLREYKDYEVIDWEYKHHNNFINIEVRNG